jgi:hypothetical protein
MKLFRHIEKIGVAVIWLSSVFYGGKVNPPKKKDILGRIIITTAGWVIIIFIVLIITIFIW